MTASPGKPRPGQEHELRIDGMAYGGAGVGRLAAEGGHGGMAVFVARAAPGDLLRVRVDRVHRRHAEASILQVLSPGPERIPPPCPHYEQGCGGCTWQHLEYEAQLAAKETVVRDSLERIGGFGGLEIAPIVRAGEPWWYRNKMEFSFHARDGLGLHAAGDWRRVVAVSECRLESELAMRVVALARDLARDGSVSYWDPVAQEGLLRELVVRHGRGTGQTMVGLITGPGELPWADRFAERAAALDPSVVSVVRAVRGDGPGLESVAILHGTDAIEERVGRLTFRLGLQTFFQTNTEQAARMLALVRERVLEGIGGANGNGAPSRLLDVFCGVGFFTLALADLVDEAIGVEIADESIAAARDNALRNGVGNARFYAGDARRTLPDVIERHGAPGLVVLDPPRGGAGGKVMRRVARAGPHRIVYVSCNPTTLARDLVELGPFGYRITSVQPMDLFPQTYHVETIVTADRVAAPAAPGGEPSP